MAEINGFASDYSFNPYKYSDFTLLSFFQGFRPRHAKGETGAKNMSVPSPHPMMLLAWTKISHTYPCIWEVYGKWNIIYIIYCIILFRFFQRPCLKHREMQNLTEIFQQPGLLLQSGSFPSFLLRSEEAERAKSKVQVVQREQVNTRARLSVSQRLLSGRPQCWDGLDRMEPPSRHHRRWLKMQPCEGGLRAQERRTSPLK